MKRVVFCAVAVLTALMVNAEQIQTLSVKLKNASKVGFSWFSTAAGTTQFKVEILNSEKVAVVTQVEDKDYWNYWHAYYDDYQYAENEHYAASDRTLFSASVGRSSVVKGDAWNTSTIGSSSAPELAEGTYYIRVTGLGSDNSVTEETAELEVELKQNQLEEDEDGNIMLNVIGFEAGLITEKDFSELTEPWWLLLFYTGVDETSDGLPIVWITINSGSEDAISGKYSRALNNVYIKNGDNNCFVDLTGNYADYQFASDVELDLNFAGFYQPYVNEGYHYGTYSGSFKITTEAGKTYVGSFNNMLCNSSTYATLFLENIKKEFVGMYGEDVPNKLENVTETSQPVKVFENGNVYILRNGKRYNMMGVQVY